MRQSDDNHIPMDQIGAPDEPVRLHLPADSRYLRLLRLVASSMAADLGFPVDELEEVRVAVDELGSALLADAAIRVAGSGIAVVAVVVDAKDANAEAFYRHHGFIAYGSAPGRMLASMRGLLAAAGARTGGRD
ncbi:MAG: hypothetical protein KDB35_06875 [Acidimicrobiales bacterium]|nr:hypothetical protein [Acidimicrobiales bacterium]